MSTLANRILNQKWLFLLFLIPLIYFSYLNRTFQLDDALIYQRYIHNLFEGYGLVYNKGEYFNGLTSPLYTYITIVATFLIGNIQYAGMILATIFMALALSTFTIVFSRYEKIYFVLFGAIFMACFPYFYTTYGMETPLFIFLIGTCIYFFEKNNIFWLGISCALLLLTRGEGVFLILAMAIEHFRQKRPFPKLSYFILPLLIIAASYLFNKFYYGEFLPATAGAKIDQGKSGLWGESLAFGTIKYQFSWFFAQNYLLMYSFIILSILGIFSLRLKSINIISISFLSFYTLFFIILNIPNYHWYYAPYYVFGFFYTGIGVAWLIKNFLSTYDLLFKTITIIFISALMPLLIYYSFITTNSHSAIGTINVAYRDIGQWLKDNTAENAKIAMVEIGTVGWYSERYIIDILGLVNPLNAKFIGERKFSTWLNHYSPDYILVHKPLWGHEIGVKDSIKTGYFVEDPSFEYPGFKLLTKRQNLPIEQQNLPVNLYPMFHSTPYKVSSPNQEAIENTQLVLMVHAPGEMRFKLSSGKHKLSGQFGILKGAYSRETEFPTDGVEFSAVIMDQNGQETVLFKRFLNPRLLTQDRGLQNFMIVSFETKNNAELVLRTHPGANNANSDWSFWNAIKIDNLN
jgi:arabinofuranosyltransferase